MKQNPFTSKTLWLNVLLGAATILIPAAQEYVSSHPALTGNVAAVANILLRIFSTKEPIGFDKDPVIKR